MQFLKKKRTSITTSLLLELAIVVSLFMIGEMLRNAANTLGGTAMVLSSGAPRYMNLRDVTSHCMTLSGKQVETRGFMRLTSDTSYAEIPISHHRVVRIENKEYQLFNRSHKNKIDIFVTSAMTESATARPAQFTIFSGEYNVTGTVNFNPHEKSNKCTISATSIGIKSVTTK